MARRAQVLASCNRQVFVWGSLIAALTLAALTLAGCGTKGFSIEDAVPDRSPITGSISSRQPVAIADPVILSDEETIRNAVSSAIVEPEAGDEIGWANANTGSRGAIRALVERKDGLRLCRRFTASRESFDGVHLYRGEACLESTRNWSMTAFDRVE